MFKKGLKMAQICNISEEVKLNCCGDKFYDFFLNKMDSYIHLFPQNLQSYKFVEGNGFTHGSVTHWKYDFGDDLSLYLSLCYFLSLSILIFYIILIWCYNIYALSFDRGMMRPMLGDGNLVRMSLCFYLNSSCFVNIYI